MVEINLGSNEEVVLGIIREQFLKEKRPVTTDFIYNKGHAMNMEDWKVRGALMNLSEKGLVFRESDGIAWKPRFELRQQQAISRGSVSFNTAKIMDCIKKIGHPARPNEVLQKFIEIYGMPENVESFLRYMRNLVEDDEGQLERDTENRYSIKDRILNTRDTTLEQFMGQM